MRAGLLRNPISISAPGSAKDAFGQLVPGGSTLVLETNAAIAAISGKEVYSLGAGFDGQVTHLITIRFPVGISIRSNMTIAFGTREFLVQFARDPDERQRQLQILCLELGL